MEKNHDLTKRELFIRLKKEYSAVDFTEDIERQKLELELRLWNLLTQMSNEEILTMPEDDQTWIEVFLDTKKQDFFFQEPERQKHVTSPPDHRAGIGRALQHAFSQKGIGGGLLKHFAEMGELASNGICPTCSSSLTSDQITEYQAGQSITCDQCGMTMTSGLEKLGEIVKALESEGEVLSAEELQERGIFLNQQTTENIKNSKKLRTRNK
ncbi:MAG: hypothetical protein ACXACK_19260 [Candidatus Hodarchaeales archaeon]|jgi:hypothetical protein